MADGRHQELEHEHEDGEHVDVVALVLGDVDGRRRAEMAAHVLGCPTCRREYDEVAANVGELLPAVPGVQPPLGFDEHVLRRFQPRDTGRRPRWAWLAAAAATLAIVVAAALGWWATRADDERAGDVAALTLADGGAPVGTVSITDVAGERVMVVAIVAAPDGVSYLCRTTFADGTTSESEAWPPGNGAWIVDLPRATRSDIETVELVVDGTDHVWSSASFGASPA